MWGYQAIISNGSGQRLLLGLQRWLDQHLFNIVVIILAGYLLRNFGAHLINRIIHRTVRHDLFPSETDRRKRLKTLDSLVYTTTHLAVWMIMIVMIVNELGINTTPLLASAGVIGIALGIGAQNLIKDFVSGIFIITENQYRVGDVVDLAGKGGMVEAITMRTTILRDLDGFVHHIPNGTINISTNMTVGFSNINEDIVVGFDTDIDQLEHIINHVGKQLAARVDLKGKILETPQFVRLDSFTAGGIVVKILGKTVESEQWLVKGELYRLLAKALAAGGINFTPTTTVSLHNSKQR